MPYKDLPCRCERSAPTFDSSDPCEIERYFDDLEFLFPCLFLKHCVSADQDKKLAAVRYPSIAAERLWRTAHAFRDTMHLYEDFKVKILALYLEAIAAYSYTLAEFDKLISDRARSPIRSESELGGFYREFLLVSRFLIAKGHIGTPEQSRAFSASLGPRLAIAVHNRLD